MEHTQAPANHPEVAEGKSLTATDHDHPQSAGGDDISVVIAFPNEVTRCGIAVMLQPMSAVSEVRAASDGPGAATELSRSQASLVITSTDMPPPEYTQLRGQVREAGARTLLILPGTGHPHIRRATSYEAEGYLLEDDLTALVLENAVQRIAANETILPNQLARTMLAHAQSSAWAGARRSALTRREHQTLQLLVDGLSNKQVATRLDISQHCAKRHVGNLIFKLECANRTQAVALALREGLMD